MYISMMINSQSDYRRVNRQVWGRLFGLFIQKGRERKGYSVEGAARLAGMEPSAWAAVETGSAPDPAKLDPMADALELGQRQMRTLVQLCRDAWEQ